MQKRRKQMLSILTATWLAMQTATFMPLPVTAAEESAETAEDAAEAVNPDAAAWKQRTEKDVFAKMRIAAENDNLAFWVWDENKLADDERLEDVFALVNKKNGYVWWSSPINAGGDKLASKVLCKELQSAMVLTSAEPDSRSTSNSRSGDFAKCTIVRKDSPNGITVTYNFKKLGILLPVQYTLCDDYLSVRMDTANITEKFTADKKEENKDKYIIAQALSVLNAFGAADSEEEGYFVIPDGSGALIRFNNQKNNAKPYSQLIYGADTTAVPKTKGATVEGVSLPMFGICKGKNAMLAVAASGDGNCYLNADVSGIGQSNTEYNRCYFQFVLRSQDSYYLGGDNDNPLNVFEKALEPVQAEVRYYPLCAEDDINADHSPQLDYVDIAARYRQYLTEEQHVRKTAKANDSKLYLDLYGGCLKQKNILGFPVFTKTAMTDFSEMQEILARIRSAGTENLVVSINRWTNEGISGKVDDTAKPAGVLGGRSDFQTLTDFMDSCRIEWYPVVNNTAFYSGNGYHALHDTAVRVSGAFARIVDYEQAYGVPYGEKKTMSLLSPTAFPALYDTLTANYQDAGLHSACIGDMASTLYGDYGKHSTAARENVKQAIADAAKQLQTTLGTVLSKDPNAYMLPYTDNISDLPLYSSGFNIFDEDIPLYQMVLHGVIPYATKAVNGSADADRLVLLAAASGSNLHFDMLYSDISETKDTDFDILYYADYAAWLKPAAHDYHFLSTITAAASDSPIISYTAEDHIITTQYANGTKTIVNLDNRSVTLNGKTYCLPEADFGDGNGGLS